jgi:hypothetical protein
LSYPASLDLAQYDGCIWALGRSQVGVKEDEYVVMTHDFPMAAARAIVDVRKARATAGAPMRFVFVSGSSADQSEKSRVLFSRIKVGVRRTVGRRSSH